MRAAVVDVGSNSIKLLVAERGPGGRPSRSSQRRSRCRISRGIGSGTPRLSADGIERGRGGRAASFARARGLGAGRFSVVATSAVRDASNGGRIPGAGPGRLPG